MFTNLNAPLKKNSQSKLSISLYVDIVNFFHEKQKYFRMFNGNENEHSEFFR